MGYTALARMRAINERRYRIADTVRIPEAPDTAKNYGGEALAFIRDSCEDLKFDLRNPEREALADSDGRSAGPNQIPYNMERDLDRLSFETAVGRFLASGTRENAFDIYYCYCEIFKPFGGGYGAAGVLLKMLSEHEENASSLLMKHRDHYAHAVYVFLMGLAIYKEHAVFRKAYNDHYGLTEGREAACHFLEYWGLAALFHDVGYPFEIAHQQMKAYVCDVDRRNGDEHGFSPYVSYKNIERFTASRLGDLNALYAQAITQRLAGRYLAHTGVTPPAAEQMLRGALEDRAVHDNPVALDYLYMDHAYFSALVLAKAYIEGHGDLRDIAQIPLPVTDAFCAVMLHNSLFRFTLRGLLHTQRPLGLGDGQPLSYLLMLCDELQCWDRAAYGQNTRGGIFAFDFDMAFTPDGGMRWVYDFDKTYQEKVVSAKAYRDMLCEGCLKKSGAARKDRCKFADDIDEIIALRDVVPAFEPDVNKPDPSACVGVRIREKKKKMGLNLSDSNYLNLYDFALALNGRYWGAELDEREMRRLFEEDLSLEYKLSNIQQAKGFAAQLENIGCFYTDRAVDYIPVTSFEALIKERGHEDDWRKISEAEHNRWCEEKWAMGWEYGAAHVGALPVPGGVKDDKAMRERTRRHHDLIAFGRLSEAEKNKDSAPMEKMLHLIRQYDGLTVYRIR